MMAYWVRCSVAILFALPLLGASCATRGMPSHSPDGRTVGFVTADPGGPGTVLWLYDMQQRSFGAHRLPDGWRADSVQWLGGELWVDCSRPGAAVKDPATGQPLTRDGTTEPLREEERLIAAFDPKANQFLSAMPGWQGSRLLPFEDDGVFLATYGGKPTVFIRQPGSVESQQAYQCQYDLYSPGDGKKGQTVTLPQIMPAGDGWTIQLLCAKDQAQELPPGMPGMARPDFPPPMERAELVGVEVHNAGERRVCTISAEEIAPACYRDLRFPVFAGLSRDQTALVLAFDTETIFRRHPRKYTFGVFDMASGKRLWTGASDSMKGLPSVDRKEIWTAEFVGRQVDVGDRAIGDAGAQVKDPEAKRFALVRHTPAEGEAASLRDELFTYDLGGGRVVRDFAPSPDGSQLMVVADGVQPQLLLLPLKPGVRSGDVIVMPVVEGLSGPATRRGK